MTAEIEERKENDLTLDSRRRVSRRSFIGLGLGALGLVVGACQRASKVPATAPTVTLDADDVAVVSPTAPPTPIPTSVPPSATPSPAPSPSPTSSPLPPADTPTAPPATVTLPPPTYTPVPATATSPPPPTATATPPLSRAALMARWPATKTSRVVVVSER